jgi:hypothetical protein
MRHTLCQLSMKVNMVQYKLQGTKIFSQFRFIISKCLTIKTLLLPYFLPLNDMPFATE